MRYPFSIDVLRRCLRHQDISLAEKLIDKLNLAQLAPLLEDLTPLELRCLCRLLLTPERAQRVLETFPRTALATLVAAPDDAGVVEQIEKLAGAQAARVLALLPPERRSSVRKLQQARAEAFTRSVRPVSSLMGCSTPTFSPDVSTREVLTHLQGDEPEGQQLYVVSPQHHLLGVVALAQLRQASADTRLRDLLQPASATITSSTPVKEAAPQLMGAERAALPVLDQEGRLVGEVRASTVRAWLEGTSSIAGSSPTRPPMLRRLSWWSAAFSSAWLGTLLAR